MILILKIISIVLCGIFAAYFMRKLIEEHFKNKAEKEHHGDTLYRQRDIILNKEDKRLEEDSRFIYPFE